MLHYEDALYNANFNNMKFDHFITLTYVLMDNFSPCFYVHWVFLTNTFLLKSYC